MSALTFDKSELGNLEYSLQREMLATDRIGGYMSTTIVCCNTRRYHGLMVAPIDDSGRTYVLLSSLDETVIQHDQTFNLALHRFPGVYEPRGHKYITDFEYTPTPTITYRVGGVILRKEMLWIHKRTQLMIRYTLVDAHSETRLRLRPFLAFRDKHALTHANMEADGHSYPAVNGVKCRLYGSFPWLYLQTSKPGTEFVPAPDWYYNFEYLQVLDTEVRNMRDGMFAATASAAVAADAPLWFFWTLQRLGGTIGDEAVWNRYGGAMKEVLEAYRRGIAGRVALHGNGLVWASSDEIPLTWMNSMIGGRPVTPRNGYQVEVNALWYNAVRYTLELARSQGDKAFVKAWEALPERIENAFRELFALPEGYLADYVDETGPDKSIRPNMILACSLPYKPVDDRMRIDVIRTVRQHLLTPKGLRTLSPRNPLYRGSQEGTPEERDFASKNGSVWPWLLSFYVRACFDIDGDSFLPQAEEILANFEEDIQSYGIGSIGELYDADPPYAARGAISQAWSVGAVLEIYHMVLTHRPAPEKTKGSATRKTAAKAGKTTEKAAKTPGKPAKDTAAKAATAGKSAAKSGKKAAEPAAGKARKATAPSGGTKKKTMK